MIYREIGVQVQQEMIYLEHQNDTSKYSRYDWSSVIITSFDNYLNGLSIVLHSDQSHASFSPAIYFTLNLRIYRAGVTVSDYIPPVQLGENKRIIQFETGHFVFKHSFHSHEQ